MKKGHFTKARIAAVVAMHDAGHSAREIGRELECSPNTALAYISRAAEYLADPGIKIMVEKWRETEADDLVILRGKARARLHEKLDADKLGPIPLIAVLDRTFPQSRLLEGKSTANVLTGAIVRIQREALELTMKSLSRKPGKGTEETARPRTKRNAAASV